MCNKIKGLFINTIDSVRADLIFYSTLLAMLNDVDFLVNSFVDFLDSFVENK